MCFCARSCGFSGLGFRVGLAGLGFGFGSEALEPQSPHLSQARRDPLRVPLKGTIGFRGIWGYRRVHVPK